MSDKLTKEVCEKAADNLSLNNLCEYFTDVNVSQKQQQSVKEVAIKPLSNEKGENKELFCDYHPNTPSSSVADENDLKDRQKEFDLVENKIFSEDKKNDISETFIEDDIASAFNENDNKLFSTTPIFDSPAKDIDGWDLAAILFDRNLQKDAEFNSKSSLINECDFSTEDSGYPKSNPPINSTEDGAISAGSREHNTSDSTCSVVERSALDITPASKINYCPELMKNGMFDYPILVVSSHGTIAVYLREACIVEMTVNKTIRVECAGKFSAATNSFGSSNCILHPDCRILQQDTRVQCLFGKNKVASFGPQGIMFNMKPMPLAYVVSSTIFKGTTTFPATLIRLPPMDYDFTTTVFYSQSITGPDVMRRCQEIVQSANYKFNDDGALTVIINGAFIRQDRLGNVLVNSRPRMIRFSPQKNTVSIRTHYVDMAVQEEEKAYVKRGVKRVHVSKSGMVVSDGNCITSMDHFGRIVSST